MIKSVHEMKCNIEKVEIGRKGKQKALFVHVSQIVLTISLRSAFRRAVFAAASLQTMKHSKTLYFYAQKNDFFANSPC